MSDLPGPGATTFMEMMSTFLDHQSQRHEQFAEKMFENFARLAMHTSSPREPALPRTSIPEFSGTPSEDVNAWLFLLDQHFKAHSVSSDKATMAASSFLRGPALQWYRRSLAERGEIVSLSYEDFKFGLRRMFLPRNHQQLLRTKLDRLKQERSLSRYITDFMNIINQIEDMSEEDRIHYFIRGLASKTRSEVGYSSPKNLHTAIEMAQNFDTNFFSSSSLDRPPQSRQSEPMEIGHADSTFKRPSTYHTPKKVCTYCKKPGHLIQDCYKKQARSSPKGINSSSSYPSARNDFIHVTISVNSTNVDALVDTGANQSLISPEVARHCLLEIFQSEKQITLADGTTMAVTGITKATEVAYKHSSLLMPFIVVPNNHGILLGMDFLSGVQANINIAMKEVTLPPMLCCNHSKTVTSPGTSTKSFDDISEDDHYLESTWSSQDTTFFNPKPVITEQCGHLNTEEQNLLVRFVEEHADQFASSISDLGSCTVKQHKIITSSETPIFLHPYRKSLKERQQLQEEVKAMLDANIIRPSTSPWSSPVILVNKPDGSFRFCTDYRALNKITPQDRFPLPRMDDVFDRLSGSKYFSTIDLKSGYWQILLDEQAIPKTAFSTPDGHYEYLRMPFGIKNAPAEFSRIMQQVLGHLPYVQIYLDDITIHSKSFEDHITHLQAVFSCLKKADLKLNYKKCNYAMTSISLLGHIICGEGVKPNPNKVKAIKEMSPPTTFKQLQQFLGMTGYYRKFISGYASIATPLYALLKKENTWIWKADQQLSFESLKDALMTAPVLRLPDLTKPFQVYTDASGLALGAILSQKDDSGKEYVCQFESRLLKGAEVHYGISEKECLGIVWAIRKFRPYLYGSNFQVITDHSSLKWLMTIKDPTGKLARWAIYLQGFDFEIIHRKGTTHLNVDVLSRPVIAQLSSTETASHNSDPYTDPSPMTSLLKTSTYDPQQIEQLATIKSYLVDNNKIYYKENEDAPLLLVPPPEDRPVICTRAHLLGHFQADATYKRISDEYFWPAMKKDIAAVIDNCLPCSRHVVPRTMHSPPRSLDITGIFDRVGIDCVFGLPETLEGYKGLLVFTEYLSKYPHAVPIKTKSAQEIAERLFEYIALFGPPKQLLSDQGTEFLNQVLAHLSKVSGIERKVTSAYHPQTNGQTERLNQTLVQCLRKHAENDHSTWTTWMPFVLLAYRTKVHSSTGFTPFELLFGRSANSFSNWGESIAKADETNALYNRSLELRNLVERLQPLAKRNITKAQDSQRNSRTKKLNVGTELQPGTQVFMKNLQLASKLQPKFSGPYLIEAITPKGNYWLKNSDGATLKNAIPLSRLKISRVTTTSPDVYEVDKILDHKVQNGRMFFLVKWKGYDEDDNTWEPDTHFDTTECIDDYWKTRSPSVSVEEDSNYPADL